LFGIVKKLKLSTATSSRHFPKHPNKNMPGPLHIFLVCVIAFAACAAGDASAQKENCVVVTGCTGWVGGWVVQELVTKG
jgi:hypothetical protein